MMPLTLANSDEEYVIIKIGGFVAGGSVSVVNVVDGNLIVNVKETRVAISREMAQKIMI